ncbi:hypothetical protein BOTBODRAFT_28990 [Botryobasidium botryosum FD-172 SS1]|uniref:ABC transporter domain-containing protein n=1 Tax=Botryobasidium botryosum (strain FD-172 SS1) TaxID=930990 RepID=A0A067MV81_BOTB1|nr:hypothetical protein BOTBODRAFT_28990 [Botryobasidium botryosum FD-172 SS1]
MIFSLLLAALPVLAQTCDNYGYTNGSSCACPPGYGGPTCSTPACGGNLFQGAARPLVQGSPGNVSSCACQSGWGGIGCNVCQTANACQSSYNAVYPSSASSSSGSISGIDPNQLNNSTITCSTVPRVWAASELSCAAINPTLQAVFPRSSYLNIHRTLDPASSLYPFGQNGTAVAQLIYDGVEQFACSGTQCTQSNPDEFTSDWNCASLQCNCRTGTQFCGGGGALNLQSTINGLSGSLQITCKNTTCAFKQALLDSLFGANGLALSSCTYGECVRQGVIDAALGHTEAAAVSAGNGLSGGVIAGLAVVGVIVAAVIVLFVWGWVCQRQAKRMGGAGGLGDEKVGGVGLEWRDVRYVIGGGKRAWPLGLRKRKGGMDTDDPKVLLKGIDGRADAGNLVAILGPSGAGKTTFVELLAGKEKVGRMTGSVEFHRIDGGIVERPRIGFVDQTDVLPATLTVREALLTAARLRLPERISDEDKQARVFEVIEQLGLGDHADSRIGNSERRGLSGGQMRRVSIGLELVAKPDVLILDEPTSGLDSVSAANVAQVLSDLAHDPKNPTLVIASIHQPSSHLYHMFDQIMVLSRGELLYYGPGGVAPAHHFAARGLPCKEGYNVADHLLDIAFAPPPGTVDSRTDSEGNIFIPAAVPGDLEKGASRGSGSGSHEGVVGVPSLGKIRHYKSAPNGGTEVGSGALVRPPSYATTFFTQVQVLSGREWKNLRRDKSLFLAHTILASILGVFCGGLYYHTGIDIAGFQSRVGCLFFLGSLLAFSSLSALYNLVEIRPLFLRERAGHYYRPSAWLLCRVAFDIIPLRIVPTLIVSTITYWMAGLSPHAAAFFKFLLVLVLYVLSITLFNFLLAAIFSNGGIAILISSLYNLYAMTYAGFFVHLGSIPPVLRWLQWLDVLKYCLEALSVNEVGSGLQIEDTLAGVPINISAQFIMNLVSPPLLVPYFIFSFIF